MNTSVLSKAKLKYVRSLHNSKFRQKYNKYIAEGDKICKEIIISNPKLIEYIICTELWKDNHLDLINTFREKIRLVSTREMKTISKLKTASSVFVISEMEKSNDNILLKCKGHILYLDNIRDPGNMGSIIRTADWFGIKYIVQSLDCVSPYNPKVIQSAMGSHLNVMFFNMTLKELKSINNTIIIGAVMNGKPLEHLPTQSEAIIVIGNEGKGIQSKNIELLDEQITINGSSNRIAESLNASIAMAIITAKICT